MPKHAFLDASLCSDCGCCSQAELERGLQAGKFRRPLLDFTAGSVRLDLGLTSNHDTSEPDHVKRHKVARTSHRRWAAAQI